MAKLKDSMGEMEVPEGVYWGAQTARAVENFPISGAKPSPAFVRAVVRLKLAAARAHARMGALDPEIARAIEQACQEILDGKLAGEFVVDPYQAGAGTSHHMNVNEVLAARANEILGGARSPAGKVHPNDHVNKAQSTNDVIPTAIRLGSMEGAQLVVKNLEALAATLDKKAIELHGVVKSGRTHLQDAAPIRFGREVGAWAVNMARHAIRIREAAAACGELGIGGTAVGSGLTAEHGYREAVVEDLTKQTGLTLWPAADLYEAMQSLRPVQALSSALRDTALDLYRISSDVRLLASGPTTGFGELNLPAVQPGSSIMPGKVNPSIAEMVGQVCARVIGNDTTVAWATASGQIELNVFFPVAAHAIIESLQLLGNAVRVFDTRCVAGMSADVERCATYAGTSQQLVLALAPRIGYDAAAGIAKRALAAKRTIEQQVVEEKVLPAAEAREILDPAKLAGA